MSEDQKPTRAELVRLRREQEHVQHLHRASKVTARPVAPRVNQKHLRPVKAVRNARRFQVALTDAPRAGHSFKMRRPHFGWQSAVLFFVALIGITVYVAFNLPELRVNEARLTGNQLLTQGEINSVLNVSGQPVFMLKPADLETRLRLNYPELVSVKVSVSLPNFVSVNVTERQPLIRWEQGGGYTWIAKDGIAFRPHGELPGLVPVLALSAPPAAGGGSDPLTPAPFISADMVQALQGLASHAPAGTTILYEKGYGFGWNDPRGWRAYFGTSANDVELKMRVYDSMVNSLTQRGIRPALINVMYPAVPYYRMTQ